MRIPPPPAGMPPNLATYLRSLSQYVEMGFKGRTEDQTARGSIILISPDGASWEVKVDNTGVLTTTKIQG